MRVSTYRDSCWNGMPIVGKGGLWLARPGLDVAMDQLPSPWPLGVPAGKDICQGESWQLYFLFHLGLFLSHSFLSLFSCASSSLYNSKIILTLSCFALYPVFLKAFCAYFICFTFSPSSYSEVSQLKVHIFSASILLCIPSVHFRVDNILALQRVYQPTELKPEGILEDSNTVQPSSAGLGVKFCSHFLVFSNLLSFCFIRFLISTPVHFSFFKYFTFNFNSNALKTRKVKHIVPFFRCSLFSAKLNGLGRASLSVAKWIAHNIKVSWIRQSSSSCIFSFFLCVPVSQCVVIQSLC